VRVDPSDSADAICARVNAARGHDFSVSYEQPQPANLNILSHNSNSSHNHTLECIIS
jgi:hypothetical protein